MKTNFKRVLSFALVMMLVLSCVPTMAFAAEGTHTHAAQNITTGAEYDSLAIALEKAASGDTVKVLADSDEAVTYGEGIILDLNGHNISNVTVPADVTLTAIDSATDDYAGSFGTLSGNIAGTVASTVKTAEPKSYVSIYNDGAWSFHRYYAAITAISLKPASAALGYKAEFYGDEAVKNAVVSYGYEMWINDYAPKALSKADKLEKNVLTLRLNNILKEGNDALNAIGSTASINGKAFITLNLNGEEVTLYSADQTTTLRGTIEAINANAAAYSETALQAVRNLCTTYASWMMGWATENIFGVSEGEGDLNVEVIVPVTAENNVLSEDAVLSYQNIVATVPAGAQLADGATKLKLTIVDKASSDSDVETTEDEALRPLDVHIEGISADNAAPIIICLGSVLPKGLNIGNYDLYHVENGETVPMTRAYSVSELDAHNEFCYDPATGAVTVAVCSFSEITLTSNSENYWNGQTDTTWYDESESSFEIHNADQLAGLGKLVDEGNNFDGKTITLISDIDLYGVYGENQRHNFNPIGFGYAYDTTNGRAFKGTFDGNGNTIFNLYQNCWDLGADVYTYSTAGGGLFASVENATIKNLTMDGASLVLECIDMGTVVGYAQGNCTFENIVVKNSALANYQRYTGGAIGEVSNGHHILKNVDVEASTTVGTLWGDFDASVGGIIGGKWGHGYNNVFGENGQRVSVYMKNCDVAATLDVYNDVTSAYQWYSYRRAGMLIGHTEESKNVAGRTEATASFLTTVNCTVQYGDWVNYHYCEFTNTTSLDARYPWVRVEAGKQCGAYSNPRYGVPQFTDTELDIEFHAEDDGCHVDGDGHDVLIVFNQLYGGGQGCYGGNTHVEENLGVTVIGQNGAPVVSAPKFESLGVENIKTNSTVTLGQLFQAVDNVDIQDAYVYAFVSPVNETDTVRGTTAVPYADCKWEDLQITFSGTGKAKVTISDYYYCQPTTIYVNVYEGYIVSFAVPNGVAAIEEMTGNSIELPTLGDYKANDKTYAFAGWSAEQIETENSLTPNFVGDSNGVFTPESDITLYPVYSFTTEGTTENKTTYTKVTATSDLSAGDKIVIAADDSNYALSTTQNNNNRAQAVITKTEDTIEFTDDAGVQIITLEAGTKAETFAFKVDTGYLYAASSSSNHLKTQTTNSDNGSWVITIDSDGVATIVAQGTNTRNELRYNSTNNPPIFSCYSTGQQDVVIYKQHVEIGEVDEGNTFYITFKPACAHSNFTVKTQEASCTTIGYIKHTCDDCGEEIYYSKTSDALGHDATVFVETVPPTCTEEGYTTYQCFRCTWTKDTDKVPATGHNYDENGVCICGETKVTNGRYYIAAKRAEGNYWYMTSNLGTASDKRYQATDSGLTTLPEAIETPQNGYVFILIENQDGTYSIQAEGIEGDNYLGRTSTGTANTGHLVSQNNALKLTMDGNSDGTYSFHYTANDDERYLALNITDGYNYFAWYKSGQKQNLTLIPVTGESTDDSGNQDGESTEPTIVLEITKDDFNSTSYVANNNTKTENGYSYTSYQVMNQSSVMQWQKSKGYITIESKTFTKLELKVTAGTFTVTVGGKTVAGTTSNGVTTYDLTGLTGEIKISVGSATGKVDYLKFYK